MSGTKPLLARIRKANVFIPGAMPRVNVLHDIDFDLHELEHTAISGSNGSGKTSFLRLLAGDLWPDSGEVLWFDENGKPESSRLYGQSICGFVSSSGRDLLVNQNQYFTVEEMLRKDLPLIAPENIMVCLESLNAVEIIHKSMASLSWGQLGLALLAREILRQPRLLLLDEYANGLDKTHRCAALQMLGSLKDKMTMLFVSHRGSDLPDWCDRRLGMRHGRLCPLAEEENSGHSSLSCAVIQGDNAVKGSLIFALENVTVYIDRQKILDEINWKMHQGEHWLIYGANGSGKSTLLRLLAGDEFAAFGGSIRRVHPYSGLPMKALSDMRENICLVSDMSQSFYPYALTALELVCSGFDNSVGVYREFTSGEKERALDVISRFFPEGDAGALAGTFIRRLSSGQLRRLFLARAMARKPLVLLLDEPFNLLDAEARDSYESMLADLAQNGYDGVKPAMVIVTHYQEDVPGFVSHCAEMKNGRLEDRGLLNR